MESIPPSGKIDDLSLWSLLIKGDQKALELLYQKYYPFVELWIEV